MKNVQVIDAAENCTFPIFQFADQQFLMIFSGEGQDIAFISEVIARLSEQDQKLAFDGAWDRPVDKSSIQGLHGTLFYGFAERVRHFPLSRRECDWNPAALNVAQRELQSAKRKQFER